ncbi:hypothetical protein [Komarekiella delphini-convector]|nr:hypothetical protein [Komarekiella delphini-convector]
MIKRLHPPTKVRQSLIRVHREYTSHQDISKMNKPIGFYTSAMPGDGSYLDELQQRYGSTFEQLSKIEKLLLLHGIVQNLLNAEINIQGSSVAAAAVSTVSLIAQSINKRVTLGEHLGLASALINQLKYQR